MGIQDQDIMCALIGQVSKAAGAASEQSVTTYISRPMWDKWCIATEMPIGTNPTGWIGLKDTARVYGSETVVVEDDADWAVSFRRNEGIQA